MAKIRWRNGIAHLVWYENGKQKSKSLGRINKREAETIKSGLEYELRHGNTSFRSFLFPDYASEYLRWYEREYPDSYYRARQIVVQHLRPFFEFTFIEDISGAMVRDYRALRTGIKNATYNKELRTLKAMLNKAVEWEYLEKNPIGHIKGVKELDSKPPHFYTPADLVQIYDQSTEFAARWQFLANTGLRRTEAIQLSLKKDVGSEAIRVLSSAENRTKSGKWREIPIFDGAKEALEAMNGESVLFEGIHPDSISRSFRRTVRSCGLGGSLHSLRHTFCSHLVMANVPLRQVQAWAGHANSATTERYAHLIPGRSIDYGLLRL